MSKKPIRFSTIAVLLAVILLMLLLSRREQSKTQIAALPLSIICVDTS